MMGFIHIFGENAIELNAGGRHHVYLKKFGDFAQKLNAAGASMVFICDGQLRTDKIAEWCRRREKEFNRTKKIMESNAQSSDKIGCKTLVKKLLKLIEDENFGEIIISTDMDCDAAISRYANENNALAVVAGDSDFFIFDGEFELWDAGSLNIDGMHIKWFNRLNLRKFLDLNVEQMKYFATIAGNDHTKTLVNLKRSDVNFTSIANFCRGLNEQRNDQLYRTIAEYMTTKQRITPKYLECIEKSIKSYDIDFQSETKLNRLMQYCAENVLLHSFINQEMFQYETNFLNYHNNGDSHHFIDMILIVFRRLGGILLKNDSEAKPMLKIVTKYNLQSEYMMKTWQPIYPNGLLS